MSERYSDADIEIHVGHMTEGMPTEGLDVDASERKAIELIREAIRAVYPQYTVATFGPRTTWHTVDIVGYPDEVDPDDVRAVAVQALGDLGEGRWYVLTSEVTQ